MKKILNQPPCLNEQDIKQYLEEQLNDDAHYRTESHLIDCSTCREATEAYASTHHPDTTEIYLTPSPSNTSII